MNSDSARQGPFSKSFSSVSNAAVAWPLHYLSGKTQLALPEIVAAGVPEAEADKVG